MKELHQGYRDILSMDYFEFYMYGEELIEERKKEKEQYDKMQQDHRVEGSR